MLSLQAISNFLGIPLEPVKRAKTKTKVKKLSPAKSTKCLAVQRVGICGNVITNGGVNKSGFCDDCWTVDIVTAHELYKECRADGMSREESIEKAMINTKDGHENNNGIRKIKYTKEQVDYEIGSDITPQRANSGRRY